MEYHFKQQSNLMIQILVIYERFKNIQNLNQKLRNLKVGPKRSETLAAKFSPKMPKNTGLDRRWSEKWGRRRI